MGLPPPHGAGKGLGFMGGFEPRQKCHDVVSRQVAPSLNPSSPAFGHSKGIARSGRRTPLIRAPRAGAWPTHTQFASWGIVTLRGPVHRQCSLGFLMPFESMVNGG